jgi:hypothetical protein
MRSLHDEPWSGLDQFCGVRAAPDAVLPCHLRRLRKQISTGGSYHIHVLRAPFDPSGVGIPSPEGTLGLP